jgi:hypothetical protein
MSEAEIRNALVTYLDRLHAGDEDTLVVEEVCVCQGTSRVDMAVVNGRLNGFEIKSDQDTLARLQSQIRDYAAVFDGVTFVVGPKHVDMLLLSIPEWCGVMVASDRAVRELRPAGENANRQPYALAQLLWRDEALGVLERKGFLKGVKTKPKTVLWKRLSESLTLSELGEEVRSALKARKVKWLTDSRQRRGDA